MMQCALVTGSTGFIGSRLAQRLLTEGRQVHAIVREGSDVSDLPQDPNFVLHRHDGATESLVAIMAAARPDMVFHLASMFLADHRPEQVEPLICSNLLFSTQLLEAMVATGARLIVNTGTAWQHYEGERYRPVNLYAATKQAFQDVLAYYTDAKGLSAITLKLSDTYGAGDKRRKLIRILGDAVRSGERLDMSPGDQILDLSHVDDVIDSFLVASERLLASPPGTNEQFLIPGERYSLRDLVALVGEVSGKPLSVHFGGRPYREREVMEPIVPQAQDLLPGWRSRRSLRPSLAELIG